MLWISPQTFQILFPVSTLQLHMIEMENGSEAGINCRPTSSGHSDATRSPPELLEGTNIAEHWLLDGHCHCLHSVRIGRGVSRRRRSLSRKRRGLSRKRRGLMYSIHKWDLLITAKGKCCVYGPRLWLGLGSRLQTRAVAWSGIETTNPGCGLVWDRDYIPGLWLGLGSRLHTQAVAWSGIETTYPGCGLVWDRDY